MLGCIGTGFCGCPSSQSVIINGTASDALIYSDPHSASAADNITAFMTFASIYGPVEKFSVKVPKVVVSSCAASGFWMDKVGGVAIDVQLHVACSEDYFCIEIGVEIIHKYF